MYDHVSIIIESHRVVPLPERSSVLCLFIHGSSPMPSPPFSSVQSFSRVRLCDPMDCSTPGLPVHHQLPQFAETHVHHIGDATQLSHPLSSPSPPAFNLSQHQGLFQ